MNRFSIESTSEEGGHLRKRIQSDFLFSRPSSLTGIARLADFSGTFDDYNDSTTVAEADAKALLADWQSVCQDLEDAIVTFDESLDDAA